MAASIQVPAARTDADPDGTPTTEPSNPADRRGFTTETSVHPAVSVVVATKDRDQLLRRAITSIMNQDYPGELQILIVRDGPEQPEATAALQAAFPDQSSQSTSNRRPGEPHNNSQADTTNQHARHITYLTNTRTPGLPGSRNTGILAATSAYVAFCDDDDEWLPSKITAQLHLMQRQPQASCAATGITVVRPDASVDRPGPLQPTTLGDLLRDRIMELHPSSFVFRTADLIGPIGLVDEDLPGGYAEDYDLLLRAAALGPVLSVPQSLTRVHWHGTSYYFSRWQTIDAALAELVRKHPQFTQVPRGKARIWGQRAVAQAAMGNRSQAARLAGQTLRLNPAEPRAIVALVAATGLIDIERIQRALHRRGRGL